MSDQIAIKLPLEAIKGFCERFGVKQFALFGSVLRRDLFRTGSDVDVLLKFKPGAGFTFENTPDIQDELTRIFNRPVDAIELERVRNPLRRRAIMSTFRVIYDG